VLCSVPHIAACLRNAYLGKQYIDYGKIAQRQLLGHTLLNIDFSQLRVPTTPVLVIIRQVLERNLDLMQARCSTAGVGLRAHGKMHKCSTLAKLQIAKGADGICAQTIGEAEAFAASGITNLLLTSPVSLKDTARVAALASRTRIAAVVDDSLLVTSLGSAARAAGSDLDLLVDIDLGQHRTGIDPAAAVGLAKAIAGTRGTRFVGIQGYLGHLQHIHSAHDRIAANEVAITKLATVVDSLRAAGLAPRIVTGGGTGTHTSDLAAGVFTEIQAGSYALMDTEYGACEAPADLDWPFAPALFLASSVISARHRTHVTCDAGVKALSTDGPAARVIAGAPQGSAWHGMGDEHGAIIHPTALDVFKTTTAGPLALQAKIDSADTKASPAPDAPKLGDTIWLQPGHCDPTINLHEAFLVAETDGSWSRWAIDARRMIPGLQR
jgi:D-serine deaminase-like pyridoxal phosphate-dependent protein